MQMEPGDTLFMYTDGVTEATDENDEDFGEDRLQELLVREWPSPPQQLVESVLARVERFTNGADPADDVTMLVIQRCDNQGTNGQLG